MSYIIPNNTKASKVLYIDSRDADEYLATKLTPNAGTQNLTTYFTYILKENIEIP